MRTNQLMRKFSPLIFLMTILIAGQCSRETQSGTMLKGVFVDAPVSGIGYEMAGIRKITASDGSFDYLPGEPVRFFVGDVNLGSATGSARLTPISLVSGGSINHPHVLNRARFLQTLDADGNPANGIQIPAKALTAAIGKNINFNQEAAAFAAQTDLNSLITAARGNGVTLVSEAAAMAHMSDQLLELGSIRGAFLDNYAGKHLLLQGKWRTDYGTDEIVSFSSGTGTMIIRKDAADSFNPGKYQKVILTQPVKGEFYSCTLSPFNSATREAAEAIANTAVATTPETSGCGGFAWSKMTPMNPEITGSHNDNYAGKHFISPNIWQTDYGTDKVVLHDPFANYLIIRKSDSDSYNPGRYQKVVYTQPSGGQFYFCTLSPFNLQTADEAMVLTDSSNSATPATSGCGGFAWTQATAAAPEIIVTNAPDNYGSTHTISATQWATTYNSITSTDSVIFHNFLANYVIIRKPANDSYNPDKYQKVVYTQPSGGQFYICTISPFDSQTALLADAIADTTDKSSPATGGCSGFSWTRIN